MNQPTFEKQSGRSAPENYERYFVPSIGAPLAKDLVAMAAFRPGERVLDVACGTGVVTRLAVEGVGRTGRVAGLDVNAGMLAVARSLTPDSGIDWYETSAEAIPLPSEAFDVVTCQMGLQFIPNKLGALREMHRVLAPCGRLVLNVPGPTPELFEIFADGLTKQAGPEIAAFVHAVFSMHDADELRRLIEEAGFHDVHIESVSKRLALPPPREFLWQYVQSTPLSGAIAKLDDEHRAALEHEVCGRWQAFVADGRLALSVRMTTARGTK